MGALAALGATFLGVLLFGRNRVSNKFYYVSAWLVWLGSLLKIYGHPTGDYDDHRDPHLFGFLAQHRGVLAEDLDHDLAVDPGDAAVNADAC